MWYHQGFACKNRGNGAFLIFHTEKLHSGKSKIEVVNIDGARVVKKIARKKKSLSSEEQMQKLAEPTGN